MNNQKVVNTKPRTKMTVYQRIIRAAQRGTGTYLSPFEVAELAIEHTVYQAALNDDEDNGLNICGDCVFPQVTYQGKEES